MPIITIFLLRAPLTTRRTPLETANIPIRLASVPIIGAAAATAAA
ncbi:hypothetical protein [Nonomuraea dietziae]